MESNSQTTLRFSHPHRILVRAPQHVTAPATLVNDFVETRAALQKVALRETSFDRTGRWGELSIAFTEPFYDIDVANDLILLDRELRHDAAKGPRTAGRFGDWRQVVAQFRDRRGGQ